MDLMLRTFIPRYSSGCVYDRPYFETEFERQWGILGFQYSDNTMSLISNIRIKRLKKGKENLEKLPENVKESVTRVAKHIPTMLEIVNARIKKTYHW